MISIITIIVLLAFYSAKKKVSSFHHFPPYYRTIMALEIDSSINLDYSSSLALSVTEKNRKLISLVYKFTRVQNNDELEINRRN